MASRILKLQHIGAQGKYGHVGYKDCVYNSLAKCNTNAGFEHVQCLLINVNPQFRLNYI